MEQENSNKYYFFWKHQFGQWTMRDMVDFEGTVYNCCEQYMMAKKARLFVDFESLDLIMEELRPRKQQLLGRNIGNYSQDIWDRYKEGVVYSGNFLKFSQHRDLKKRLLETSPRTLVEASPNDTIWGIGLSTDDALIWDERNWRGQNLLGKVLMRVRDNLI